MKVLSGTFSADGDSTVLKGVKKFTVFVGTDGGTDFGSGSLTVEVRPNDAVGWTTAKTFISETVDTSIEYVGGTQVKLTLASSTSPDLDYSISYEN